MKKVKSVPNHSLFSLFQSAYNLHEVFFDGLTDISKILYFQIFF